MRGRNELMAEDIFKDKFSPYGGGDPVGKSAKPRPPVDFSKYKFLDEPAVKSVGRSVAGRVLGAAGGLAAGVLLTPTPAGEGSDKLPGEPGGPVPRAKGGPVPEKNVDNSGLTKEPLP
jgi:hypothetical protein